MKVAARGENMSMTKQVGAWLLLFALSACDGTSNLDQISHVAPTGGASGKTDSETLPPLHSPAVSILKDPRLIWDRKGVMLPIWGMGYNPNDEWMPGGYECFLDEPFIEEKNITESGYHLQAFRSQEGDVFSFFVTGVHVTRKRYLFQLIWNEDERAHLLAPKSQGGLEVSLQELNQSCGMGVLASLYGQYATIGFKSHLNAGETTPPVVDLYFDNTSQGRRCCDRLYSRGSKRNCDSSKNERRRRLERVSFSRQSSSSRIERGLHRRRRSLALALKLDSVLLYLGEQSGAIHSSHLAGAIDFEVKRTEKLE